MNIPQKIKLFLWKTCHNALPVLENLRKKKLKRSTLCPLSELQNESIEHMLLFCEWTRGVWFGLQIQCIPQRCGTTSIHEWIDMRFKEAEGRQEFSEFYRILVCCAMWSIWKERNLAIFESKKPNPIETLHKTNMLQADYHSHWIDLSQGCAPQGQIRHVDRVWRPPPRGVTKLNIDASFTEKRKIAHAGIVARNEKGQIVAGLAKIFPATSPLMAEALSFREPLTFAGSMGMTRIIVESDSLELVQACRNKIVRGEVFNIVKDIVFLKTQFQHSAFTWVSRVGNGVAHQVAHLACRNQLPSS